LLFEATVVNNNGNNNRSVLTAVINVYIIEYFKQLFCSIRVQRL